MGLLLLPSLAGNLAPAEGALLGGRAMGGGGERRLSQWHPGCDPASAATPAPASWPGIALLIPLGVPVEEWLLSGDSPGRLACQRHLCQEMSTDSFLPATKEPRPPAGWISVPSSRPAE